MSTATTPPIVLTIAGSDSGGGAGIQADIKAISATGGYACSVITALTAQNTQGVAGVLPVPADFISQQLDTVFTDLNIKAVKIGMLGDQNTIRCIAAKLRQYQPQHIVLDPVMVATSGDTLLPPDAITCLISELLPLAQIITPNLPEAAILTKQPEPHDLDTMGVLIPHLQQLTESAILLKGGHLKGNDSSTDFLITKSPVKTFTAPRINTTNTHGTGCTLSAAIACYLAQGAPLEQAVAQAKEYLTQALQHADILQVGHGHGPVNHFYNIFNNHSKK